MLANFRIGVVRTIIFTNEVLCTPNYDIAIRAFGSDPVAAAVIALTVWFGAIGDVCDRSSMYSPLLASATNFAMAQNEASKGSRIVILPFAGGSPASGPQYFPVIEVQHRQSDCKRHSTRG